MPYTAITRDSRHPFELLLLVAGVVTGSSALASGLWPNSLEQALFDWMQPVWGSLLGGGALVALLGIWMRNRATGVLLEQVGLTAFGSACSVYGGALLVYNFPNSLVVSIFFLLIAVACVWQYLRIERAIKAAIARGQIVKARRERRGGISGRQ